MSALLGELPTSLRCDSSMRWYIEDPPLWPDHLPVRYAEVVSYSPAGFEPRLALVIDTAPSDPRSGEDRVSIEFYDDGDTWIIPAASLTPTGRVDREKAGPWRYPTLADGSIIGLSRAGSPVQLVETLGLWYTDDRKSVRGYAVRLLGDSTAIFAEFDDLRLP